MHTATEEPLGPVRLSSVNERDLDLLLLEEFVASPQFLSWFVGKLKLKGSTQLLTAAQSVSTSSGESDLELKVRLDKQLLVMLIEDKINAGLQPRQAARYAERAAKYRESGACDIATTVLVAPQAYGGDRGFEHKVSYESILEWFQGQASLGSRLTYKLELLKKAVAKPIRPPPVPDVAATAFCTSYWELASAIAPELEMRSPRERSKNSSWLYFRPAALPSGVELVHKVGSGRVDLHFAGMGKRMAEMRARYGQALEPGMHIVPGGKSAIIRIVVPPIDIQQLFEDHAPAVRDAIKKAQALLSWYCAHGSPGGV